MQKLRCELHAPARRHSAHFKHDVEINFTATDSVADGRPSCLFQISNFNTGNLSNTWAPRVGKKSGANCTLRSVDIALIKHDVQIKFTATDSVADGRPSCLFQIRHFNTGNLSSTSAPKVGKKFGANCTLRPVDIALI